MSTSTILLWIGLLILAAWGPGPCLVASLRVGLRRGPQAMVETGVGFALSAFVWTIAALSGLTVLLSAHPSACTMIAKVGGLAVVAIGMFMLTALVLRGPRSFEIEPTEERNEEQRSFSLRTVMSGFGVHAISPGTPIFFIGVTPVVLAESCPVHSDIGIGLVLTMAVIAAAVFVVTHCILSRGIERLRMMLETKKRRMAFEFAAAFAVIGGGAAVYF